ncbi:MAG: hypothetical protein ACLQO6_12715, partial [Desulfomonilaceae bacterium]
MQRRTKKQPLIIYKIVWLPQVIPDALDSRKQSWGGDRRSDNFKAQPCALENDTLFEPPTPTDEAFIPRGKISKHALGCQARSTYPKKINVCLFSIPTEARAHLPRQKHLLN